MIKTFIINPGQRPTDDQIKEVLEAKKQPITFDEDFPEMSPQCIKLSKVQLCKETEEKPNNIQPCFCRAFLYR